MKQRMIVGHALRLAAFPASQSCPQYRCPVFAAIVPSRPCRSTSKAQGRSSCPTCGACCFTTVLTLAQDAPKHQRIAVVFASSFVSPSVASHPLPVGLVWHHLYSLSIPHQALAPQQWWAPLRCHRCSECGHRRTATRARARIKIAAAKRAAATSVEKRSWKESAALGTT